MPPYYLLGLDLEVVKELLPLGDALIGAGLTLLTAGFTYVVGRRRNIQEVENLQAEKKSIEAASGVSTAEAAQIISTAAAATIGPLTERIRAQAEEINYLTSQVIDLRFERDSLRNDNATIRAENKLMRERFRLQGESPPELPPEVNK